MHITFQLKNSKIDATGKAPIYARITINGRRKEFSIKRNAEPAKWIKQAGVVRGTSEEARSINNHIATIRLKLQEQERTFIERNIPLNVESVINAYLGIKEDTKFITAVFEQHNCQMRSLINKDFAPGTYERYTTALKHLKEFIRYKYGKEDVPLADIDYGFITAFERYLKTIRNCGHNTTIKYITNFKKVVRICLGNGWIIQDPFINYKIRLREVRRDVLTMVELETIIKKRFSSERLSQVRDVFIFCCFTGLAYADVKKLTKDHLVIGVDNEIWIKVHRTKTGTLASIPLLPPAQAILERYKHHPITTAANQLLPVLSNQKMNDYIKEIVAICDINKNVSCHTARHSFSTSVMLNHNVPLESISKLLGHSSLQITQHYARTVDTKISSDVLPLKEKLKNFAQSA